jgi:hypothetical protein
MTNEQACLLILSLAKQKMAFGGTAEQRQALVLATVMMKLGAERMKVLEAS